ncbi:MAG: tripartite tricarboxylate transporter substrate binding protein [Rhodoplanes sp.]|uniref:Bug family tripartite tricarboxylate transporter substrate binding protein n=1 Tax=Rhodoplanes sp. TaxID=1968906 RepID=UPI0017B79316|nr:tripartite tricarboxylate transporter substrate binding protein [Rhodoplanes sp.]NVO14452.1 tripartite tricarboxylate transporter substrate binding protein [Rhodoplanes sp.]
MRMLRTMALAGAALLALATSASAQGAYPNQMVRIVVPFSAGSVTDGLARILADKLADVWKQQVIVENRPGLPGTTSVAKGQADGYTLMLTSNGHTIAGVINKSIQFDPVKDFAGVTKVASVPMVAVVPPDLPVKTMADFIALAKEKPGKLNFSSAGIASTTYLSSEVLKQAAKIDIVHVPYKGTPEATTAVIRGDAQLYFAPIPMTQELSAGNKVRAIAINSSKRSPQLPDVPTVTETVPSYDYDSWFAVLVAAGTPKPIIDKVSQDIAKVLAMPDVIEKLQAQGAVPSPTTPEALDAQVKRETELYTKVLRDAGVGTN